jgi:hypothetical protein
MASASILAGAAARGNARSNPISVFSAATQTQGSSTSTKRAHRSREVIHSGRKVHVPSGSRHRKAR